MVQLNALLHVTLSKFNPCKREIVFLAGMFSCIALTGYLSVKLLMILLFICITWSNIFNKNNWEIYIYF